MRMTSGSPTSRTSDRRINAAHQGAGHHQPEQPHGSGVLRQILEGLVQIAREHQLLLLSDEIYDRILFDGAVHIPTATLAPDLLCLTFNGLSKTYRVAGFRSGWMVITGPQDHAKGFIRGDHAARVDPSMPERPGPARPAGGALRRAVDRGAHRSDRAPARAAGHRLGRSRVDPRRLVREAPGGVVRVHHGSTRTCMRSGTTRGSSTTCWSRSTSSWSRAPASTGPPLTTFVWSRSPSPSAERSRRTTGELPLELRQ